MSSKSVVVLFESSEVQTFHNVVHFAHQSESVFIVGTADGNTAYLSKPLIHVLVVIEEDADEYYSLEVPVPKGSRFALNAIQDMLGNKFCTYLRQHKYQGVLVNPVVTQFKSCNLDVYTMQQIIVQSAENFFLHVQGVPALDIWVNTASVPKIELNQFKDWYKQ